MRPFNVEVFNKDFQYKSSCQVPLIEYSMDYLSLDNSIAKLAIIKAAEGDYILISGENTFSGVVTSCEDKGTYYELQFKPMLTITDVTVHYDKSLLSSMSLEDWIAGILNDTYKNNQDTLQNITGFNAVATTSTINTVLDISENIGNLYEIIKTALIRYSVAVDFSFDIQAKSITASVSARREFKPVIEADLPNILKKSFILKQADRTTNKLSVFNALKENEYIHYYLLSDGSIVTDSTAAGRITPVIFSSVYVEHEEDDSQTFEEMAYEKAVSSLTPEIYNNLIELTVMNDDSLIKPGTLKIGQKVTIVRNGIQYETVLTGKKIRDSTTLIFGAVRLELTKTLKRRMKQ